MKMDKIMCESKELEFAIFCIENIASRLHVDAQKVYVTLSEQTNILKDYIIPEYEVLHTQNMDYVLEDEVEKKVQQAIETGLHLVEIW